MYIKRLGANTQGRDFVCGDIHGSWSCVEKFLAEIHFDESKDRLICAGDLVDRGPDNVRCLDLLYKPWFHMTKGNHEQLMEDYFEGHHMGVWWPGNGGMWGIQYKNEPSDTGIFVQGAVEDVIKNLPYIITVEKKDGSIFHVLHAELYARGKQVTDADLADEERIKEFSEIQTQDGSMIMWGRFLFIRLYDRALDDHFVEKFRRGCEMEKMGSMFNPNLSHIYSGHTIVRRPVTMYGQTNLDTQAYGSYEPKSRILNEYHEWQGLTVTEPETGKFWLVNDRTFKEVEPLIIM